MSYWDAEHRKQVKKKSPFRKGDESERQKAQALAERLEAHYSGVCPEPRDHTVKSYLDKWKQTRTSKETGKDDIQRIADFVLPTLGDKMMRDVTSADVYDLVIQLKTRLRSPDLGTWTREEKKALRLTEKAEGKLAAASIRNIYGALRVMFAHAASVDRIIAVSPVSLPPNTLPTEDTDATEIFSRENLRALMSHPKVPEWRRIYYALAYFTGTRIGETTAFTWSCIADAQPLPRLSIMRSFRPNGTEKVTKTGVRRRVPVHPVLATLLDGWRHGGFERYVGRPPRDSDLIVPNSEGGMRSHPRVWQHLQKDLETIGAGDRKIHALRTTFISTLRFSGVDKEFVRVMSHGKKASRDVLDRNYIYWDSPDGWLTLCNAVMPLWPVGEPTFHIVERHPELVVPQSFHTGLRPSARQPLLLMKSNGKGMGEEGVEPPTSCV